jgi:uncharacterized protein YecE (DUF72 family)
MIKKIEQKKKELEEIKKKIKELQKQRKQVYNYITLYEWREKQKENEI